MNPSLVVAAALLAGGCTLAANAATPAEINRDVPSFDCAIEPNQTIELRSAVEGTIERVLVQRGDRFRAGQVLVQLESAAEQSAIDLSHHRSQMQGRIQAAQARASLATLKLARAVQLHNDQLISVQAHDEAQAEMRLAEADLRDAQETQGLARVEERHNADLLSRRQLRAPFDGVVVERLQGPGEVVETGIGRKPILKLAQIEPLRIEVVLPVAAWGRLPIGSVGTVIPETVGGRYPAKVVVIDAVFDSASGTFGVRMRLDNAHGALPAGIRCRVELGQLQGMGGRRTTAVGGHLP